MSVIMPAEASLDVFKAAYVLWKKHRLNFCDFIFAYPTRAFPVSDGDVLLNIHIDSDNVRNLKSYSSYAAVMDSENNPVDMRFLEHIPDAIIYCFSVPDKTTALIKLFASFDNFALNMRAATGITELLSTREILNISGYTVVVGKGENYLSPEDRVLLFKNGRADYIVFHSNDSYGVQKCMSKKLPYLSNFVNTSFPLDRACWFTHRLGHLVLTKQKSTPSVSFLSMVDHLRVYLSEQTAGVRPRA